MSILQRIRAWRYQRVLAEIYALDDEIEEMESGNFLANQDPTPAIRRIYRRRERLEEKLAKLA